MNLSRRSFIESGALVVAFSFLPSMANAQAPLPGSLRNNRMLNAWLRIDPNGTVTIFSGKIELGQGVGTALAQIAADELDVDMKRIEMIHGDTALTPNEGQTAGSQSMQDSGTAVRFACAEAREMLLAAATTRLSVPVSDLKVADGTISAPGEGGRTTRPKSMPGMRMSCTYAAPPVNFFGMSRRAMFLPTHLCSEGNLGFAVAVASRLRSTAPASSQ